MLHFFGLERFEGKRYKGVMSDEYASLKNVAWQYKLVGWVVGIGIVLLGLFYAYATAFTDYGFFPDESSLIKVLVAILILIITALVTWLVVATIRAVSEFIHLCIRVEYNTRARTQAPNLGNEHETVCVQKVPGDA